MSPFRRWIGCVCGVLAAACGEANNTRVDAANTADAGVVRADAGPGGDAGAIDAGVVDGGALPPPPVIAGPQGAYEVPVTDPALVPYSHYQVSDVLWRVDPARNRLVLEYTFPAALAGTAQLLDFDAPATTSFANGPVMLVGPAGTATCSLAGTRVTCNETLAGVVINQAAVNAAVASGTLAPQRAAVTRAFGADPIGILRFELP